MQKDSRKKIIVTAAFGAAAVVALCVVLACGKSPAGETGREDGPKKTQTEVQAEKETRLGLPEKERRTYVPDVTVHEDQQKSGNTAGRVHAEHGEIEKTGMPDCSVPQEVESTSVPGMAGRQETPSRTEPEPTAHVHSYVLTDTRSVEHPAVTDQVWVEDSPAWDEVTREGYHVCVVTCHECGAQFADPSQTNALMAWGDHIDAFHDGDGGYDMAASYDVPAEVCHHEATGHHETRTATEAWTEYIDTYRCSCGDSYTKIR